MKLALVTETFPPEINGVAMTFGVIATELGRRGHAVTVYRPHRPDLLPAGQHPAYAEVALPGLPVPGYRLLRFGLPAGRQLRRRWRLDRPDLVHVATEGPMGFSAIRAAESLGIPVTSSFHTNFHAYTAHYRIALLRRAALGWLRLVHNRTRCTLVPTESVRTELAALGFRNLGILSRGVDTRQFRPDRRSAELRASWGAAPDQPVVLHVGRMAPEKNYELLFATYAAIRAAAPQCRFVLAGEGPLKAALVRRHPDCHFAGFFSREEIGRYYASADIYVHASLTETFGNVLTEAMASGLAVAGFDYAAAALFVQNEVSGLKVPCGEPQRLIEAAVRLATDATLRRTVRAGARAAVETQSWETVIGQFESDLAAVAASGAAAPGALGPLAA